MLSLSRRAWTHFEPIHAVVYFATETRERYAAAGLRGGWMGYFASRSAPMGAVGPEVVAAVFHNFQPAMVRRAIPDAWRLSNPEAVIIARLEVVDAALRRLWGDVESASIGEAAELALHVSSRLRPDGRPLYAGHAGLDTPAPAHLALWHACSLLREHRFDGHVAALTAHGLDGIESLITSIATGAGIDVATLRRFRGWSDDEWHEAEERLQARGLLDAGGVLTAEGTRLHAAVEDLTDELAAAPWEQLEVPRRERLLGLLRELAGRLDGPDGLPFPNPIGVPRPA